MGRDTIGMVADSISALEKKVVNIIPFGVLTVDARYRIVPLLQSIIVSAEWHHNSFVLYCCLMS